MDLIIGPSGAVRCLYGEAIDLAALGTLSIARASHVETDRCGRWITDLAPIGGPTLGPFPRRSDGLRAERAWLAENWLVAF